VVLSARPAAPTRSPIPRSTPSSPSSSSSARRRSAQRPTPPPSWRSSTSGRERTRLTRWTGQHSRRRCRRPSLFLHLSSLGSASVPLAAPCSPPPSPLLCFPYPPHTPSDLFALDPLLLSRSFHPALSSCSWRLRRPAEPLAGSEGPGSKKGRVVMDTTVRRGAGDRWEGGQYSKGGAGGGCREVESWSGKKGVGNLKCYSGRFRRCRRCRGPLRARPCTTSQTVRPRGRPAARGPR
jgi:hypothetical protein